MGEGLFRIVLCVLLAKLLTHIPFFFFDLSFLRENGDTIDNPKTSEVNKIQAFGFVHEVQNDS